MGEDGFADADLNDREIFPREGSDRRFCWLVWWA